MGSFDLIAQLEVARRSQRREEQRAARAGDVARRHESMLTAGARNRRLHDLHALMATTHRATQRRHLAVAELHSAHVFQLQLRLAIDTEGASEEPLFMRAVADVLGARSTALSLTVGGSDLKVVASSDPTGEAAQQLESTFGEGPAHDVARSGDLVLTTPAAIADRWPQYGSAVTDLGVHSLLAVSLGTNSDDLGSLVLLDPPVPLDEASIARPKEVAVALTEILLDSFEAHADLPMLGCVDHHEEVHQATGMVMHQVGCSGRDALDLIRARAFADGVLLDDLAHRIVTGATRFGN